jgi:hypothetical protein
LRTGTAAEFPEEDSPNIVRGTLGEAVKQMLEVTNASGLPWVPPLRRVERLLGQYTRSPPEPTPEPELPSKKSNKELLRGVLERARRENWPEASTDVAVDEPPNFDAGVFTIDETDLAQFPFETPPSLEGNWGVLLDPTASSSAFDTPNLGVNSGEIPSPFVSQGKFPLQQMPPQRDMSVFGGERFCFKGVFRDRAAMEAAVSANGGIVTGGAYKHTSYGVLGQGWKPTASWIRNDVQVVDEDEFWQLLEGKRQERERARMSNG